MPTVERSALLAFDAERLCALVHDIEAYPAFMPGCVSATVESREGDRVRARLGFRFSGISDSFATENQAEHLPDGRHRIHMNLLDGPFRALAGVWDFQPLAEGAAKVSLRLTLEFGNRVLETTLGPLLDRAINGAIDAFRRRATELYGKG
ncbi:MAG TPA: SRPBCC family protein [Solimonas sp.]